MNITKTKTMENSKKKVANKTLFNSVFSCVSTILETAFQDKDITAKAVKALNENSSIIQKTIESAIQKSTKSKKTKDPNAPKRPKSNYILFCEDRRKVIKDKNPTMSAKDLIIQCGKDWNSLNEKEKQNYINAAAKDKQRFSKEMESYTPPDAETLEQEKPKRKSNGYFSYASQLRASVSESMKDSTYQEVTTEISRRWKTLTDSEKQKYASGGSSTTETAAAATTSTPVKKEASLPENVESIGSKSKKPKTAKK